MGKTILVTGAAGFIGFHVAQALLARGDTVIGVDNFTPYYDVKLKKDRLAQISSPQFSFYEIDISDKAALEKMCTQQKIDQICHLAAQAGVRYSLQNPLTYEQSNNHGTLTLLELARAQGIKDFVFASSSSVYGGNTKIPFSTTDSVDRPVSLYAATKRYNELIAHTYSHLFGINCTGLRFFTVYGPWGRPDMAYFGFTKAISEEKPIDVYNQGEMKRDFTYITDIVKGILAALDKPQRYKIYNLGNSEPVELLQFIRCIEQAVGKEAKKLFKPMQPGDVKVTYADIKESTADLDFKPEVKIEEGIRRFVNWYREYYKL